MIRRIATFVLVAAFSVTPALAQSQSVTPLQDAIRKEATAMAQRPAGQRQNPYKTASIVLIGAGAAMVLFAYSVAPSLDCGSKLSDPCTTGHHPAIILTGLGAMGAGAFLFFKGRAHPMIAPVPGGFVVAKTIKLGKK